MSEIHAGDRITVACPACSPDEAVIHEVLKPGGTVTVRCTECHHVHKTQVETTADIEVAVVVSQGEESFHTRLEADPDETIEAGDEFIVDTDEAIHQVRVTSIEIGDDRRTEHATMSEVDTVWTRVVDNVSVNVTLHPKDGNRDQTRSLTIQVPGDYEFRIGETESFGEEEFEIEGIYIRREVDGYRFDKLDHEGDMVFAKDIKRIYARDETTTAWSAW